MHSDSFYNQDHMPVLQQPTIEGHAVRATLLATGVAAMALENGNPNYCATADRLLGTLRCYIVFSLGVFFSTYSPNVSVHYQHPNY